MISSVIEEGARDHSVIVPLETENFNFKIAFAVQGKEGLMKGKSLDDPRYVEWAPYLVNQTAYGLDL